MLKCKPRVTQQEEDKHSSFHLTQHCLHIRWTYVFFQTNKPWSVSIMFSFNNIIDCLWIFFILLKVNSRVSQGKKNNKSMHTCKL